MRPSARFQHGQDMLGPMVSFLMLASLLAPASLHAFQLSPAPSDASTRSAFLKRYCVTCHNDRLNTAGFSLERYEPDQVGQDAPIWEKVAHKLRAREMPPAGAPRPTGPSYDAMVHYL